MAHITDKALFFTTSPRTPVKMIPEIRLLNEQFDHKVWNKKTQEEFIDALANSDFFEGKGATGENKSFSARDRINRAPKSLGFVDLKPHITLTDAGRALAYGKRPEEIFLRQLLKFQLPSPYHVEHGDVQGEFYIRPYLEIIRLVHELGYITLDEFKIFAVQLTDYRKFDSIKAQILKFRKDKEQHRGKYKKFVAEVWNNAVLTIYDGKIAEGKTKTRETMDASLKKFVDTKKRNFRDYADACFRYLRYTGLVSVSQRNHSISIFQDRAIEVEYILANVDREPVFIDDEQKYKAYLFDVTFPVMYVDDKKNVVETILRLENQDSAKLSKMSLDELKDIRDSLIARNKQAVIDAQVSELKSYSLYSDIQDTFDGIVSDEYYDAPLMFEYNTWRAMTMLDGGDIRGNFKFDDAGQPMSTASGNMPDIECDYTDYSLSVEVTLQSGQRQFESEGESVARHFGQLKKKTGKDTYCLFIAPTINAATLAHFYGLNHMSIALYGGRSKIIPLELNQFKRLVENSYKYNGHPNPSDVRKFLDLVLEQGEVSQDENDWQLRINTCVDQWLMA